MSIFNLSGMELDDVLNLPDNELYTMFKEDPRKAHGPEDLRYDEFMEILPQYVNYPQIFSFLSKVDHQFQLKVVHL